jgi:hypothetical protein
MIGMGSFLASTEMAYDRNYRARGLPPPLARGRRVASPHFLCSCARNSVASTWGVDVVRLAHTCGGSSYRKTAFSIRAQLVSQPPTAVRSLPLGKDRWNPERAAFRPAAAKGHGLRRSLRWPNLVWTAKSGVSAVSVRRSECAGEPGPDPARTEQAPPHAEGIEVEPPRGRNCAPLYPSTG